MIGVSKESQHLAFTMGYEFTGRKGIADYYDLDVSVANKINTAFDNLIIDKNERTNDFVRFLDREVKERVYFGQFDDIKDFVRALRRSKNNVISNSEIKRVGTSDKLPIVNVSRVMSVDFSNTDRQINRNYGELYDESGNAIAIVDAFPNEFQYKISVLAWDKISLDLMVNAISSFFLSMRSKTSFSSIQRIMGGNHDVECAFSDTLAISFDDVSASIQEQRLYGSEAVITVVADLLVAYEVVQKVEEYRLAYGVHVNG